MKKFRQLISELPTKKVVFAFGRFQPPTTGHELLVNAVKKVAHNQGADHVIFASRTQDKKSNPLPVNRKVYYLRRMFPGTNFVEANDNIRTFMEAAKELSKKYKNLVMIAGSDRVQEYKKLLEKYNGDVFTFDTIEVVSAGERDPDADSASGMSGTKMREAAKKGDFVLFKKGLPHGITDIDGKRLMNEIRQGMGLDVVKEQIKFETTDLREQYRAGQIFNVGDKVTDGTSVFEVVDRGANYITVVNESGDMSKKWLDSVKPTYVEEDVQTGYAPEEISFKGYTTKNLHHSEDATRAFQETIGRYNKGEIKDAVAILNALKATDTYMKINDSHLLQNAPPDEKDLAAWHDAHDKARDSLNRIGEFMHHFDYWHNHEHEIQDMENKFTPATQGAEFADSYEHQGRLIEMKFTPTDKIKVARIIASTLGIENVEKSSNPEQLVNMALRKIRSKPMRPEYIDVLHKMLSTAKEAGIEYDEKLVPKKVNEAVKLSALDKFRAASAERERKHDAIEAERKKNAAQGKENMSASIDRLEKHLSKEETQLESDQAWAASKEKEKENALTTKDKSTLDKVKAMMAKEKKPMKEESELDEAHKIGDKVKIVSGSAKGIQGTIGEIRRGSFKGAPKTFTVYHSQNGATQVKKQHIRAVKEETEEVNEISKELAGNYVAAVNKKQLDKTGLRPNMYNLLPKKNQKGIDRAFDRLKEEEEIEEERGNADKHWDIAQGHKEKADLSKGNKEKFHAHMSSYHDSMANYHSQIGQHSQAEAHSNKAEIHHEKSLQASNESVHHEISTILEEIANAKILGKPTNELQRRLSLTRQTLGGKPEEHESGQDPMGGDDEQPKITPEKSVVGHSLVSPEESPSVRRMKVKYVSEAAMDDAEKAKKETEKANLVAKHAKEKEQLSNKQASESERLKESIPSTTEDDMEEYDTQSIGSRLSKTAGLKEEDDSEEKEESPAEEDKEETSEEAKELDDLSDDDLESIANEVEEVDDVMDVYDDEELAIIDDETGEHIEDLKEEVINEVLSRAERIRAKTRFAKTKAKRERRARVALKTRSSSAKINSRARRLAIKLMKQRIAKKPLSKLSIGEKERLERIIERRKKVVNRLAMKLVGRVRKIENARLTHKNYTK